jgi:hypothetical protein
VLVLDGSAPRFWLRLQDGILTLLLCDWYSWVPPVFISFRDSV